MNDNFLKIFSFSGSLGASTRDMASVADLHLPAVDPFPPATPLHRPVLETCPLMPGLPNTTHWRGAGGVYLSNMIVRLVLFYLVISKSNICFSSALAHLCFV